MTLRELSNVLPTTGALLYIYGFRAAKYLGRLKYTPDAKWLGYTRDAIPEHILDCKVIYVSPRDIGSLNIDIDLEP